MNAVLTFANVLLAGIVATLVTLAWQWFTRRRENEIVAIREQLAKVYGPLHYLNMANQNLFKLIGEYQKACVGHEGQGTAERVLVARADVLDDLIKESNSFGDEVKENNKLITAILRENWHLVDVDDFECFSDFHVDRARDKRFQPGMSALVMYKELGPIFSMRTEMSDRINAKFTAKKRRLGQLVSRGAEEPPASPEK